MPEDQKFPAMGGDFDNMADGAASLVHAMNANTFTAASFNIAKAENTESFASALKDEIMATQWSCGFPETLVIYTLGDYVVYFPGNGESAVLSAEEVF